MMRHIRRRPVLVSTHYTDKEKVRMVLQDLVSDMRVCHEAGALPSDLPDGYLAKCQAEFRRIWPHRHTARVDAFGWPIVPGVCTYFQSARA